jgi:molybdenum cofactor cytidylyltransferase
MASPVAGILLAAGSATRFGGGKLLACLPDGRAIGLASYQNLRRALEQVLVVVRKNDPEMRGLFERAGARIVDCVDASEGMSRSLIAGIRAAPSASGWLIALGDMPFVRPETIGRVAESVSAGALLALPVFRGRRGHPVAFSRALGKELLEISGDEGARAVVLRHAKDIDLIECEDEGILRDIDTRTDLPR